MHAFAPNLHKRSASSAKLLPTLHKKNKQEAGMENSNVPPPIGFSFSLWVSEMRVESLALKLKCKGWGEMREKRRKSEPSEKCANLVTKLARYFNIFRFAAAAAVAFFTLSLFAILHLPRRTWYKSQPVGNYDRWGPASSSRCIVGEKLCAGLLENLLSFADCIALVLFSIFVSKNSGKSERE